MEDKINMDRIFETYNDKIMSAEQAAALVKTGMVLGCSGFGSIGYPKVMGGAIAALGQAKDLTVLTGASVGKEFDGVLAENHLEARRLPYMNNKTLRANLNSGETAYIDMHLSHLAEYLYRGDGPHIDIAIVECAAITAEGVVPPASVGNMSVFLDLADKIILEVNESIPMEIRGMHDIWTPGVPPYTKPIPMMSVDERIGTDVIPVDPAKVAAIVLTNDEGSFFTYKEPDEASQAIAANVTEILRKEVAAGRMPKNLPPLQAGTGSTTNCLLQGLAESGFTGMRMYTEVVQDPVLDMIRRGIMDKASSTCLSLSREGTKEFYENIEFYRDHLILRNQEISNNPELARRLGIIALNTPIECDIYGNINSSHVMGTKMMNGIGGSGDFARNAGLTIFSTESVAKGGAISCIVPMCAHVDHTEHDVHIIVTEQGYADLRWKSPRERATLIIENCAHPDYRPMLREYFNDALRFGGQTPHDLSKALSWHQRFVETGSMK